MFDRRQKINLACALVCAGMLGFAISTPRNSSACSPVRCACSSASVSAALGIVFLFAGLHRVRYRGAIVYAGFIFFAAAAATWVAGRHVWIQHQPPGTVPACGAPLDNLLQMFPLLEVIRKVMTGGGECGNVDWTMLGISMPGWVLIAAVCLGLVGIVNNAVYPVRVRR